MTSTRISRAASVLGGVGAVVALALATPPGALAVPLLHDDAPDPPTIAGPVSAALPRAETASGAFDPPVDGLLWSMFAHAPADPGSPARAARDAVAAHEAARAGTGPARRSAPGAEEPAGDRSSGRTATPSTTGSGLIPSAGMSAEAAKVVELTNAERAKAGCPALGVDPKLVVAAQRHSADMARAGYFSHDSQDGRSFADRIRAEGAEPGAENIAAGQPDAESVVQAWMDSPGHRANILTCSLTTIGVGRSGAIWTQDFGR